MKAPDIMGACGVAPAGITYECNATTATCTAFKDPTHPYPTYAGCKAECGQQFKCVHDKCVVSQGGVAKASCEALCG